MYVRHKFIVSKMNIHSISKGRYIVAVSGGVDSVVLLDLLVKDPNLELIIAHVDHGIREDSNQDAVFVEELAEKHGLKFNKLELTLGKEASEDLARRSRYEYLKSLQQKYSANSIITAHHQDDVIETAFINLVRGTGFWGLSSLKSGSSILRPMLNIPKKEIINYANINKLVWREDSTNKDKSYLRNKLRHEVVNKMDDNKRNQMLSLINRAHKTNNDLDRELKNFMYRGLHKGSPVMSRKCFISMPHDISKQVLRRFILDFSQAEIDRESIERATVQIKTLSPGKTIQLSGAEILLTKRSARLKSHSKTGKKRL